MAKSLKKSTLVCKACDTVCARASENEYVVAIPNGVKYELLTPVDLIVTPIDMEVVESARRPSITHNLQTAIMRACPYFHAVIHTHSTYTAAFSVVSEDIRIIREAIANLFGIPILAIPYMHLEELSFVSTLVERLGNGFGVLLGSLRFITVGKKLVSALERVVTFEEGTTMYFVAYIIGKPTLFSLEEASKSFDFYHFRYGQTPAVAGRSLIGSD